MEPNRNGISADELKVIDKMCQIYRENVIKRYRESVSGVLLENEPHRPEILGINALIAEHLHNHGYVLTQSVFSSEIELPRVTPKPDDEDGSVYRLKQQDIIEVLGAALNGTWKSDEIQSIVECYQRSKNKSLLSVILSAPKPKLLDSSAQDLLAFNKYLKILVGRIAKVSLVLSELKRRRKELNQGKISSPSKSRKRSVGNNHIHELVRRIERLTNRLSTLHPENAPKTASGSGWKDRNRLSYRDWIKELRSTRNGQKMIHRIEKIIVKSLKREQVVMQGKLETQKMLWRLHYKEKFLEHFQALNLSSKPIRNVHGGGVNLNLNDNVQAEKDDPKRSKESAARDDDEEEPVKVTDGNRKTEGSRGGNRTANRPEPTNYNSGIIVQDKQIRLRKVEQLVNDAKNRIIFLQAENERLDQSFNTYLQRQSIQTVDYQKDVSAIWESYNADRLLLKERGQQRQPGVGINGNAKAIVPGVHIVEECNEVGKSIDCQGDGLPMIITRENSSNEEFSNPFINFDIKRFLESTRTANHSPPGLSLPKEDSKNSSCN